MSNRTIIRILSTSCIIIFLALNFSRSDAQLINKFGVKGGVILSGMMSSGYIPVIMQNQSDNAYHFLTFDAGVFVEWFDSKHFCLSTELHYNIKGEQKENPFKLLYLAANGEYKYGSVSDRFQYLSFQLLPKWKFIVTQEDNVYLFLGPKFDYRVGAYNADTDEDIKVSSGKMETGFAIGFGNEVWDIFRVDFKYEQSFSSVYNITYGPTTVSRRNASFVVLLGISFKKAHGIHL